MAGSATRSRGAGSAAGLGDVGKFDPQHSVGIDGEEGLDGPVQLDQRRLAEGPFDVAVLLLSCVVR
jgi:hypothetical protein